MPSDDRSWIGITTLQDFPTAEAFLKDVLNASGQSIKQQDFERTWLTTPLKKKQTFKLPLELLNRGEIWPTYQGPSPCILSEQPPIVAIHKPAGIHTHPLAYEDAPNLLSWLVTQGRHDLLQVNLAGQDRGCLYRLDQPTSGLVLYAQTTEVYKEARKNFAEMFLRKIYLCIVKGEPGEGKDVTHHLVPFGPKGATMKVASTGQRAVLSYQTLKTVNGYSLVQVQLKTGLRHQIRVQFAALGFPLLGDTQYGGEAAERMFLHCYRYDLKWQGKELSWQDTDAELFDRFFDLHSLL